MPEKRKPEFEAPSSGVNSKRRRKAVAATSNGQLPLSLLGATTKNSSESALTSTSSISEYVLFLRYLSDRVCSCYLCHRWRRDLDDGTVDLAVHTWRDAYWNERLVPRYYFPVCFFITYGL